MVTIDELKEKFGSAVNVAPYGECFVIPGSEFDPDWEVDLGDQGFRCHFGDLDGRPVTFVKLNRAVAEGKVVYVPPKPAVESKINSDKEVNKTLKVKSKAWGWSNLWTEEQNKVIADLWNSGKTLKEVGAEVSKKFPNHSKISTQKHVYDLQKKGVLKRRNKICSENRDKSVKNTSDTSAIKSEKSTPLETAQVAETVKDFDFKTDFAKELEALRKSYDLLNKAFVDLKTEFDKQSKFVIDFLYVPLQELKDSVENLNANLPRHKHAVSGEAMLPMEGS